MSNRLPVKQPISPILPDFMNTNSFVAAATLLLIVVYLLVVQIDTEKHEIKERFVPASVFLYFEQQDGLQKLHNMRESTLTKNFREIDFTAIAHKLQVDKKIVQQLEEGFSLYRKVLTDEMIAELFGNSFALALDTPIKEISDLTPEEFLRSNGVIVSNPSHGAHLLSSLAKTYGRFSDSFRVEIRQYGKHFLHRITTNGETVTTVAIDDFLLISFNEKLLRKCVDTYDGEIPSLNDLKDFQNVRSQIEGPAHFLYLSVEKSRTLIQQFISGKDFPGKELVEKELSTTKGFTGVGYGVWTDDFVITERIIAHYNEALVNEIVRSILQIDPEESSMLRFTTGEPAAYYWSNTFDLYHILPYLLQEENISQELKDIADVVRKETGTSMTEILSWLGEEVSLTVEGGYPKSYLAIPLVAGFLKTSNGQNLQQVLTHLSATNHLSLKEGTYKDATYHYLASAPHEGLQLLYGFWEEYLFFSNSAQFIHRIIDNIESGNSIHQIRRMNGIDPGVHLANNSVTFSSNVELIEIVKRFLNFATTMIAMEDRNLALKSKVILHDIVNPIMDGLKMYDRSSTRSYFAPNLVFIDSKTHVVSTSTR